MIIAGTSRKNNPVNEYSERIKGRNAINQC